MSLILDHFFPISYTSLVYKPYCSMKSILRSFASSVGGMVFLAGIKSCSMYKTEYYR